MDNFNFYDSSSDSQLPGSSESFEAKNRKILMEEQYRMLQKQKEEMIAQQKYREEQRKGANFEKWLLIFNTAIAIAALLVSIFK